MGTEGTWKSRKAAKKNKIDLGNGLDMDRIPGEGSLPRVQDNVAETFPNYEWAELLKMVEKMVKEKSRDL